MNKNTPGNNNQKSGFKVRRSNISREEAKKRAVHRPQSEESAGTREPIKQRDTALPHSASGQPIQANSKSLYTKADYARGSVPLSSPEPTVNIGTTETRN